MVSVAARSVVLSVLMVDRLLCPMPFSILMLPQNVASTAAMLLLADTDAPFKMLLVLVPVTSSSLPIALFGTCKHPHTNRIKASSSCAEATATQKLTPHPAATAQTMGSAHQQGQRSGRGGLGVAGDDGHLPSPLQHLDTGTRVLEALILTRNTS